MKLPSHRAVLNLSNLVQFRKRTGVILGVRTERSCYMTAKEGLVNGTNQQRWINLCEQAKNEQDPQKSTEVFTEIDRMVVSKADRLRGFNRSAILRGV